MKDAAPQSLIRSIRILLVLVTILLIGGVAWNAWYERHVKLAEAETIVTNISKATAQHARDTIEGADNLLVGVVELVETSPSHLDKERLQQYLARNVSERPSLRGLFIYDSEGNWTVNSSGINQSNLNNSDRDYFQHHKLYADRGPYVGPPITSRSTGLRIITVSRRIDHPDGSFAGVALATISVDYFKSFYDTFAIGEQGAILLATSTGKLLTRRPFNEKTLPDISKGPVFQEYIKRGPAGIAMVTAPSDGILRLYAYRQLDTYPALVAIGLAEAEIFAPWRERTFRIIAAATVALIVLWAFGIRLIKQLLLNEKNQHALEQAKNEVEEINDALAALALKDGLTGLANRRSFDAVMDVEFSRAIRNHAPLAVIMIDVDFFKKYNDAYGHVKGDECLRLVGSALAAACARPTDLVARYGGEEFCLILSATDTDGGITVAEKVLHAVRSLQMPHAHSDVGFVTVSVGVASIVPVRGNSAEQLLNAADSALYTAKTLGRNQLYSHDSAALQTSVDA